MDCQQAQDQLSAYHDGERPAASAEAIAAHLVECPACRDRLDRIARLDAALMASASTTAVGFDPRRLRQAVARRIDRRAPSRAWWRRWRAWASIAAAAMLVASFSVVLIHRGGRPGQPVEPLADSLGSTAAADLPEQPAAIETTRPALPEPAPPGRVPPADVTVIAALPPSAGEPIELTRTTPKAPRAIDPVLLTPSLASAASQVTPVPIAPPAAAQVVTAAPTPSGVTVPPAVGDHAELLRKVEVILTRAATIASPRSPQWSQIARTAARDDLVAWCRRARQASPADVELARVLASAEALLVRVEMAGESFEAAAGVDEAILGSNILVQIRQLRAAGG